MNAEPGHDLARVGLRIAAEQDRLLADRALPDADALLAGVAVRRARARSRRNALAVAGALLAALLVVGAWRGRSAPPVEARGAPATAPPAQPDLGPRHAEAAPSPLRFVDGTRIVLLPDARADLRAVSAHGATIALERGALDVDVVHTEESRWDIVAGRFDIRVTGTRFQATWDPETKRLTVAMAEGTVRVSGPCIDEPLAAPGTKVFSCDETPAASATDEGAPSADGRAPSAEAAAARPSTRPGVAETASALLASADTARLAGDVVGAREIYTRVRTRFPRTAEAAKAAFLLGRIAESSGAADDAVGAYAAAMNEGPTGAFAQEALGRTMSLEQRRGDHARARELATTYLKRHPQGPYRAYAVSILDSVDAAR